MPTQRERDGPPARKRGRGRIGSHTSTPRPTQNASELVNSNTSRLGVSKESPGSAGRSDEPSDFPAASAPLPEGHMTGFPSCWICIRRRDDGPNGRCWSSDVPMVERGRESWNGCSLVTAYPATAA